MAGFGASLLGGLTGGAIGSAVVRLVLDSSQYRTELAKAETSGKTSTAAMGNSFGKFKIAAGFAAASAGAALVKFGADAVGAASRQEEALNKVNVVFGQSSALVTEFAETSAEAFGVSKSAALDAAGGFGNMLLTAGLTEDAAASMSVELVGLASDLASFNNIAIEGADGALAKLRSGLAGEAEPLRRLGVLLSETRVKAEAYATGIAKTGAELTEAQKVQARYSLILKDTATAQGDFARTSDGLANQQRSLSAAMEDLRAEVGEQLLPIVEELVPALTALAEVIAPLLSDAIASTVGELTPFLEILTDIRELLPEVAQGEEDAAEGASIWSRQLGSNQFGLHLQTAKDLASIYGLMKDEVSDTTEATGGYVDAVTGARTATREAAATFEDAADEASALADAHKDAAKAAQEQWNAEARLAGGTLGLIASLRDVRAAEKEVNDLRRQGKLDTAAGRDAILAATEAQLGFRTELQEYRQELRQSGLTQAEVRDKLKDFAAQVGISADEFKDAIGPAREFREQLEGINRLPRDFQFDAHFTVTSTGTFQTGGGIASGGIIAAASGLIARRPTFLVGEGNYSTFAGRGAEAVIPLNDRGISILAEAVRRGMGSGSGGQTIVLNGDVYAQDADSFRRKVVQAVESEQMRKVLV